MTLLTDRPMHGSAHLSTFANASRRLLPLGLIVGWVLIMRWPYATTSGPDDAFFTEVAQLWRQGVLPYAGAFDVKPPGFFAVLALVQSIFGPGFAALRVIGALSDIATLTLTFYLGRRFGAPGVGIFAIVMFAHFWQKLVRDDSYSLLMALTTIAMAAALSSLPVARRAILAGLAIGVACTVKQTAVFEGAAALILILVAADAKGIRVRSFVSFSIAAAVPPLLFVAYFTAHGALVAMLTDVVGFALQRPGAKSDNVTLIGGLKHFAIYARGIWPLVLIAGLTGLSSVWRRRPASPIPAMALWFGVTLAGIVVQHALLPTYFGVLLVPTLLLAGLGIAELLTTMPSATKAVRIGLVVFALVDAGLSIRLALAEPDPDTRAVEAVATRLAAAHPTADDRLYVIDARASSVWLYVKAPILPATPYLIPSQSMCDFPNVGPRRIAETFATRPRFVVTEVKPEIYPCAVPGVSEAIASALARDYRQIDAIARDGEAYAIYEAIAR